MNFDDQDWEIGQGRSEEAPGGAGLWRLALGVALGMVLGGALMYGLVRQPERPPTAEAAPAAGPALHGAGPTAAGVAALETLDLATPGAAEASAPAAAAAPVVVADAAPAPPATPEPDPAARAARRALQRKERAWAAYYKKPAACDDNPSRETMIECANHYIRAKRQFEESYAAGGR